MATVFAILVVCLVSSIPSLTAGKSDVLRCYACTSYIEQCKSTVEYGDGDVFKTRCNTKCFVRHGEDGAIYRGCFDGFVGVPRLNGDYVGCKNMSWPFEKRLTWCLCDDDLCNGASMDQMANYKSKVKSIENEVIEKMPKSKMSKYAKEGEEDDVDSNDYGAHYQMQETNHGGVYDDLPLSTPDPTYPTQGDTQKPTTKQEYEFRDIYFPPGPGSPGFEADKEQQISQVESYKIGDAFLKPRPFRGEFYNKDGVGYYGNVVRDMYYPYENEEPQLEVLPHIAALPPYDGNIKGNLKTLPFPRDLAERIPCGRTGFYQNPDDCRTFVACIRDPRSITPIMHLMRCPEGLVWDNMEKICKELSSTCNVMVSENYGEPSQYGTLNVQDNHLNPLLEPRSKGRYEEVDVFPRDFYDNNYHDNRLKQDINKGESKQGQDHPSELSNSYKEATSYAESSSPKKANLPPNSYKAVKEVDSYEKPSTKEWNPFERSYREPNFYEEPDYLKESSNNYPPPKPNTYTELGPEDYELPSEQDNIYGGYQQQQRFQPAPPQTNQYNPPTAPKPQAPPQAPKQINYPPQQPNYQVPQNSQQPPSKVSNAPFSVTFRHPVKKIVDGKAFQAEPKPPTQFQVNYPPKSNGYKQKTNEFRSTGSGYQAGSNTFQVKPPQQPNKYGNN